MTLINDQTLKNNALIVVQCLGRMGDVAIVRFVVGAPANIVLRIISPFSPTTILMQNQ